MEKRKNSVGWKFLMRGKLILVIILSILYIKYIKLYNMYKLSQLLLLLFTLSFLLLLLSDLWSQKLKPRSSSKTLTYPKRPSPPWRNPALSSSTRSTRSYPPGIIREPTPPPRGCSAISCHWLKVHRSVLSMEMWIQIIFCLLHLEHFIQVSIKWKLYSVCILHYIIQVLLVVIRYIIVNILILFNIFYMY